MLRQNLATIYPEENDHAIRNPLMGFRSTLGKDHEYGTLIKTYFKWNELEKSESDGVDKIKEACDSRWRGCEQKNIKLIPRVYLAWPRQKSGWPADMKEGDFTSDQFKQRVIALIKKLGNAWDNDSRVAFVEMGLVGQWGEMEWPNTTDEIKAAIAAQFAASFQNKLVMVRWAGVPTGEYIVALAILDPAGGRPSARFAIKNYYNGGRRIRLKKI